MRKSVRPAKRRYGVGVAAFSLAALLPLASASPASAHAQKKLSAEVLSGTIGCDEITYPQCWVEGDVVISNKNRKGTGKLAICVGIEVHTMDHDVLSYQPPDEFGQAIATVRAGKSKTVEYKALFDMSAGEPEHVHLKHVHKSVVHDGGQEC
jgi:hypothetical protein